MADEKKVTIVEVGPRDGLQNEPVAISTEQKLELIERLIRADVKRLEATAFVHPARVPQMADAADVMKRIPKADDVSYLALVPNAKGFERAKQSGIEEITWVTAASATFNRRNINQTMEENLAAYAELLPILKASGVKSRFAIATSFGCPFEGKVEAAKVLDLAHQAAEYGADEISVADTIGIAVPNQVSELSKRLVDSLQVPVSVHFHDTRGLGLANCYAAYEAGVRIFDSAAGGLGGCPFAPGAAGNVATEDLVYMFEQMGISTGINFSKLLDAADYAVSLSTRTPMGRIRLVERKL